VCIELREIQEHCKLITNNYNDLLSEYTSISLELSLAGDKYQFILTGLNTILSKQSANVHSLDISSDDLVSLMSLEIEKHEIYFPLNEENRILINKNIIF
jgi:hypothetical protein